VPGPGVERPVLHSSMDAVNLIVTEEDSGQAYYATHYTHFDWPEGASGPTVAIGYDCGYSTAEQIKADWLGFIPDQTTSVLMEAAGITGSRAKLWVERNRSRVTITWEQALAQFMGRELPKWEARIIQALPNALLLSGDCFGVLTSIGFNRGTGGFHDPGPHFVEMRAITTHMAAKEFSKIPAEILAMRRLWPNPNGDLYKRRTHEAFLFSRGLAAADPSVPVA
jgi:hypothetical protein